MMQFNLVSTDHGFYDFDVVNGGLITRVTVSDRIKKGDTFNIFHGTSKSGATWLGKHGIEGYLIGDVERSVVCSEAYRQQIQENPYILPSEHAEITTLILGGCRNPHVITKRDRFLDNGVCIQLLKERPMKFQHAGDSLVLDDQSLATIRQFRAITHSDSEFHRHHGPDINCRVFSIVDDHERFTVVGYSSEQDVKNKKSIFIGAESYYENALVLKNESKSKYHTVKVLDSDQHEVNY